MRPHALIVDNGSRSVPLIAREVTSAGWACTVLPLTTLPRAGSAGPAAFDAVILSGTDLPVWAPVYHDELDLIRSGRVPLLGICGGLQLIGRAFGADLEEGGHHACGCTLWPAGGSCSQAARSASRYGGCHED